MYLCILAEKNGKKCFPIILRCIDTLSLYGLNSSSGIIKSIPNQFTSFSYLTFDLIPTVEYNALKQNKKTKSISLYFVSIIPEKSFKSLLMSETLMYPGESDVILIRSIFVDYIVANGLAGNGVSPLSRLVTNIFLSISQRFLFLIIKSNLFTNKYGITTFHIETILTVVFPKSIGICNNSFLWLYTNFTTSM